MMASHVDAKFQNSISTISFWNKIFFLCYCEGGLAQGSNSGALGPGAPLPSPRPRVHSPPPGPLNKEWLCPPMPVPACKTDCFLPSHPCFTQQSWKMHITPLQPETACRGDKKKETGVGFGSTFHPFPPIKSFLKNSNRLFFSFTYLSENWLSSFGYGCEQKQVFVSEMH